MSHFRRPPRLLPKTKPDSLSDQLARLQISSDRALSVTLRAATRVKETEQDTAIVGEFQKWVQEVYGRPGGDGDHSEGTVSMRYDKHAQSRELQTIVAKSVEEQLFGNAVDAVRMLAPSDAGIRIANEARRVMQRVVPRINEVTNSKDYLHHKREHFAEVRRRAKARYQDAIARGRADAGAPASTPVPSSHVHPYNGPSSTGSRNRRPHPAPQRQPEAGTPTGPPSHTGGTHSRNDHTQPRSGSPSAATGNFLFGTSHPADARGHAFGLYMQAS